MAPPPGDNVPSRGHYGPSPTGTATFVGLRALDVFVQYTILSHGSNLLNRLSIQTIIPSSHNEVVLGLPLKSVVLLAIAAGSTLKHVFWATYVSKEEITVPMGFQVGVFNTIFNSLNSMISLTCWSRPLHIKGEEPWVIELLYLTFGVVLYGIGILTETASEVQRKRFKDKAINRGQVFTGGLFAKARHINYGGYTIWRTGYAFAAGGSVWAMAIGALFAMDFVKRGIPVLDLYCARKYGSQWEGYKRQTPYKLWPMVY